MKVAQRSRRLAAAVLSAATVCWAARCTTELNPALLKEYDAYVRSAEETAEQQFLAGELSFVPGPKREAATTRLNAGKTVKFDRNPAAFNERLVEMNGSIFHNTGAILIRNTALDELAAVIEDYTNCTSIYEPLVYECSVTAATGSGESYRIVHGYHYVYRFIRAMNFSFRAESEVDRAILGSGEDRFLRLHQAALVVRESISGMERSDDLFEPGNDHGILWDFDAYWRARAIGNDLYVEFDVVTLGRSVQTFSCKVGIIPVPRAIIARVAKRLPSETVELMLTATKRECERRAVQ